MNGCHDLHVLKRELEHRKEVMERWAGQVGSKHGSGARAPSPRQFGPQGRQGRADSGHSRGRLGLLARPTVAEHFAQRAEPRRLRAATYLCFMYWSHQQASLRSSPLPSGVMRPAR